MNIIHGDCLEELKKLDDNSVDAVVTDPPYGLSNTKPQQVADVLKAWVTGDTVSVPAKKGGFMGKDWDSFVPPPAVWEECMRVLKPGGHMAVFAGARTQDLMGLSIRLAGFEIRDTLGWIHSQGFPKGQDLGKIIDKKLGAQREAVLVPTKTGNEKNPGGIAGEGRGGYRDISAPATSEAKRWTGWNSQLKPAIEPIILARKPLDGTVANNVLSHGVGGLNIDACRVQTDDDLQKKYPNGPGGNTFGGGRMAITEWNQPAGRFPANVLLDEHSAKEMDKQSGVSKSPPVGSVANTKGAGSVFPRGGRPPSPNGHGDEGGASRFFPVFKYQAKAPKKERPVIEREDGSKIQHSTVKPLALMEWLVSLIVPPGGVVLDPFAGSGTTLQAAINKGFQPIGIEQDADYIKLIEKRLEGLCTTHKN